jgi:hypothetical protein
LQTPSLTDESINLHSPNPKTEQMLNCLQLSPRFQVLYGFRFESPFVPLTAFTVFQFAARSENRQNSINT